MLLNLNKALISANIRWLQIFKAPLVNGPSLLYIIFIQMFFSLRSKTCNISSLGIFVRMGFCPTENRRDFCPGWLLSGGPLVRGTFVQRGFCPGLIFLHPSPLEFPQYA